MKENLLDHMEALSKRAQWLCKGQDDWQDLLQETLLRAYTKFHLYQPGSNLRAWLYTIMQNVYINMYRAKQRRPQETELFDRHDVADVDSSLVFTDPDILKALSKVHKNYRDAFVLHHIEGYSHVEISNMLGIHKTTSATRTHRAGKELKKLVKL